MTVTWTLRDGLKWSDGEALTCDDFKYAWEWVLDEDNVGVITAGSTTSTTSSARRTPRWSGTSTSIYEGYITLLVAPLPRHYLEPIPMADQVQGAGFRADEVAEPAGLRRVQVRVGHAGQRAAPGQNDELHELLRPASPPTSTT